MERPVHNPLQDSLNEGWEQYASAQQLGESLNRPSAGYSLTRVPYVLRGAVETAYFSFVRLTSIENDFCGWLADQVAVLHSRQYELLDYDALAEELEEMGRRERDALVSDLEVVLSHMLKLAHEVRAIDRGRNERLWKQTIAEHRHRLQDILARSGTLDSKFDADEFKGKAYKRARQLAGIAIAQDQQPIGPSECPWSKDQILADDFFPTLPNS
jgi:hypothetical protein